MGLENLATGGTGGLRNLSTGGADGLVNLQEISEIPDSGLVHHYDWSEESSADTITDLEGSDDLSATESPDLSATINGLQAGFLNGVDDFWQTTFTSSIVEGYEVFIVGKLRSVDADGNQALADSDTLDDHKILDSNVGQWGIIHNSNFVGNNVSSDTDAHLFDVIGSGTDELLVDASSVASGSLGNVALSGLTIGANAGGGEFSPLNIGEAAVYNKELSSSERSDVESYFADKWGLTF